MSFKENTLFGTVSKKLLSLQIALFEQCPRLEHFLDTARSYEEFMRLLRSYVDELVQQNSAVSAFLQQPENENLFAQLQWPDWALVRLHDYLAFDGLVVEAGGAGTKTENRVFHLLWQFVKEHKEVVHPDFMEDLVALFRQLNNQQQPVQVNRERLQHWMRRHPDGLQEKIVQLRKQNKERIIRILKREIEKNTQREGRYYFAPGLSEAGKLQKLYQWWDDYRFHLRYAVRDPHLLNEMLDFSLSERQMRLFEKARDKGIPFFVNPYYLSLILVNAPGELKYADQTIRDYIFYNEDLVHEFGKIEAWEKEDKVEPGKPNAAGWILPNDHNIHRRYPEVAIFIPDTVGRACGGLCVSCQRMYDFQRGNLNFNLKKLRADASWPERLRKLMDYFEQDADLKDILITGGDALMSSTASLQRILDAVYEMALRKREANKKRPPENRYAGMKRIRLGTRLPVYLPQRIDDELVEMLRAFRAKAMRAGIEEFVIQVHFESPMEISPESARALQNLARTGWMIANQQVFTAAASRRGYAARLRQLLNELGVFPYYTFTVKGYRENRYNFAPNARSVQEMQEEKVFGKQDALRIKNHLHTNTDKARVIRELMQQNQLTFLATDRNVFNLPAVGKSMNFRVVGLTADGRRILMFHHDRNRRHAPSVNTSEAVFLVESKSIAAYLRQLWAMGEDPEDYLGIYGYSIGFTEPRADIFQLED